MKSEFDYSVIADFLDSSVKERIIYELSSPKKRAKAFERFSHGADSILNPELIRFRGKEADMALRSEIEKGSAECRVLTLFGHGEERSVPIGEGFSLLEEESSALLLLVGDWLVLKPEHEGGEGCLYVLKK